MKRNTLVPENKLKMAKQKSDVDFGKIMTELQEEKKQESMKKIANIKAKVLTIARFNRMLKNAKENQELLTKAKKYSTDGKLPQGTLLKTVAEI